MAVDLLKSKEYKALQRCAAKQCPQFKAIAAAQAAIAKELELLASQPTPDRIKRVVEALKAFHRMDKRRDALICNITKCTDAYVTVEMKRTDAAMQKMAAIEKMIDIGTPVAYGRQQRRRARWTKTGRLSS